ncbi:MAG: outer membrane beta-barrel protein [Neomegalonema sp.]|nr:outer membrane beta-barrel protein [Neomegalonema sp.]
MKNFLAAALILAAGAAPALARTSCADSMSSCSDKVDFSGFYIGGHIGVVGTQFDGRFDSSDTVDSPTLSKSDEFGLIGLHAGYLHQFHSGFVVGVEIDASFTDLSAKETADKIGASQEEIVGTVDFMASARIRAGYAIDKFMPYATAGVGVVSYEYSFQDQSTHTTDPGQGDYVKKSKTALAGVVGAGVEYAFDDTTRVRLEGLYYAVEDEAGLGAKEIDDADSGDFGGVKDVWTVRLGVSFKF